MFHVDPNGSTLVRAEYAPLRVPLLGVVEIGTQKQLVGRELDELVRTCSEAWTKWGAGRRSNGEKLAPSDDGSTLQPDVLCVVLATNNCAGVSEASQALNASTARAKFLMLRDARSTDAFVELHDLSTATFVSPSLRLLFNPLRWLSSPPGLIGIDLVDYMSVCAHRWSFPVSAPLSKLNDEILARLPFEGLALTFGGLPLAELDRLIDGVKTVLPESVDLIWRDAPWLSDSQSVDMCFAYDNPADADVRPRPKTIHSRSA
jgi:hypothetical protein